LSEKKTIEGEVYKMHIKEDGVRREERTFGGKCKAYCGNIKPKLKEMKPTKAKTPEQYIKVKH
jgi:hypothetical protein